MPSRKKARFMIFFAVSSYTLSIAASGAVLQKGQSTNPTSSAVQIDLKNHVSTRPPAFEKLPLSLQNLFTQHEVDYTEVKQYYSYQVNNAWLRAFMSFWGYMAIALFLFAGWGLKITLWEYYMGQYGKPIPWSTGDSLMVGVSLMLIFWGVPLSLLLRYELSKILRPGAIVLTNQGIFILYGSGPLRHFLYEDLVKIQRVKGKKGPLIIKAAPGYGRSLREAKPYRDDLQETVILKSLMKDPSLYRMLKRQLHEIVSCIAQKRLSPPSV